MDSSFSKSYRLLTKKDFQNTYSDSQRAYKGSVIYYFKKNNCNTTRLGFGISKKNGNSVQRHRLKRLLVETFRNSDSKMLGVDVIFHLNTKKIKPEFLEKQVILDFTKSLGHLRNL